MTAQAIRDLYYAEPFGAFELVLTNGSTVRVNHPEFISFAPDNRTLHVWEPTGGGKRIDIKLIVALNELAPPVRKARKK